MWHKQNYLAVLLSFYTSSRSVAYLLRHKKRYNFLSSLLIETVWILFMNVEILIHLGCFDMLDTTAMLNPAPLVLINNYTSHVVFCKGYSSGISAFSNKQNFLFCYRHTTWHLVTMNAYQCQIYSTGSWEMLCDVISCSLVEIYQVLPFPSMWYSCYSLKLERGDSFKSFIHNFCNTRHYQHNELHYL